MPTRNVLLMIADDWSPLAGCLGSPVIQTPNVDALAARGTTFTQAFCVSPSCAASRGTLLTGHYPHQNGQYGHTHGRHHFSTMPDMPTVPLLLGTAGYATACVGKSHCAPPEMYPWDYEPNVFGGHRNVRGLADGCRAFLQDVDDQPFYLHVGFGDPHRDFGNQGTYPGVDEVIYHPADVPVPDFLPDHPAVREELAEYYRAISRLDQGIGMVLQELERAGHAEDTLVICMSDHGMPFPGAKASSFDTGHHCPLFIASPEQRRRGHTNDALLNWCNLMPTILDWCEVEPPELPERSLLPILDDEHPTGWDQTWFSHCFHEITNYFPYRVLRGRQYKYTRVLFPELTTPLPSDLYRSPTWHTVTSEGLELMGQRPTERFLHREAEELIDLEADPLEAVNLIDEPALADIAESHRQAVRQWRRETNDLWIAASLQAGEPGLE